MIDFLLRNWDSIIVVVVLAIIIVFLLTRGKRQIVAQIIYRIVTELEKQYGPGTGNLKLAAAVSELYPRLPAIIRIFATETMMVDWIEDGLLAAKERWAENAAIEDYIDGKGENVTYL